MKNQEIAEIPELEKIKDHLTDLVGTVINSAFRETEDLLDKLHRKIAAGKIMAENGSPLLNVEEAASYLRTSRSTVNLYKSQGKLKETKIRSRIYFRLSSLDEFIEQRERESNR